MGEVERSKEVSDRLKSPACAHWKIWQVNWEQFFQSSCTRHPKAKKEGKKKTYRKSELISWHCGGEINKIQIVGNFNRARDIIS